MTMIVLLIAGMGVILAGLAAIGFGVPVKEFGFGNTLILTGAVGVCTGLIMISLGLVVREMRKLAATGAMVAMGQPRAAAPFPRREPASPPIRQDMEEDDDGDGTDKPVGPASGFDPGPRPNATGGEPDVPPWQDEVLRDRERLAAAKSAAEEPKRRNLLFTSTRRDREKDRTDAVAEALELDLGAPPPHDEAPRFDDDQQIDEAPRPEPTRPRGERPAPRPDRPRFSDALRQAARASTSLADRSGDRVPDPTEIPDRDEPAPAASPRAAGVTVLKSGVVDGMAYSLYSDGSIEAQMPEGLMRFGSIDDLREHLDNRT
jgi:hypothetical protein